MSFDRVLPKPLGLHHEFSNPLPTKTSSLFEHKIMNHDIPRVAVDKHPGGRPAAASCRDAADIRPSGASSLSSLKPAKVAFNKIACTASPVDSSKPMAPLLTRNGPVQDRSSSASPVQSAAAKEPAQFCLCQPDPKIPRPRNAFILYRQHYQASVVAQNPGLPNPEISKIIGEHWRTLPENTKHEWKALAEEEKIRHQQQYPDYRYQPRRYGRDGHARGGNTGVGQNPSGSAVCNRCGGRTMNPPVSPGTPLIPNGSSAPSSAAERPNLFLSKRYGCRQDDSVREPTPIKVGSAVEPRSARPQQWDENGTRSPDSKRRRFNPQIALKANSCRDNSTNSPYPISPYTPRSDGPQSRGLVQGSCPPRPYRQLNGREHSSHDPSLKLPPLQTSAPPPTTTPITPYSQDGSSIEATLMTIPVLNKIKLLARISPPLSPHFRYMDTPWRGPVIAVDGQDPAVVAAAVDYLDTSLKKEGKYHVRVFDGPELRPHDASSESGQAVVDYLSTISAWHPVSNEVVEFVKTPSWETKSAPEDSDSSVSPKTIIPQTASLQIDSPAHSSESGVDSTPPPRSAPSFLPVALVPRYQLTVADTYACTIPISDSYTPLDHWQWMASLWRSCVGPDVTVYIRECEKEEVERLGGNVVEVRLQDAGTIVVRKVAGSTGPEEKTLRRVGFELEDFLAQ